MKSHGNTMALLIFTQHIRTIKTMKKSLFAIILVIVAFSIKSYSQHLPAWMTEEEKALMPAYLESFKDRGITTPPPHASLRNPAEWEEMQAVAITWRSYQTELIEIVRYAREECDVYIICNDSNNVKSALTQSNVSLSNVYCLEENSNSVWIRDYGPNSMYVNDVDSLFITDWIYNRPRPADDLVPEVLADAVGVPMYETTTAPWELVHTGGNFCSDGLGTGFSEYLVVDENSGSTIAEIDTIMKKFMGIERYIKLPNLPYDGIHHIDMHFKLLNEETLLVAEYPAGVADGPQIEANLATLMANYNSVFGTPYKVVRIPSPPSTSGLYPDNGGYYRTYTNSLILNKTVLVPTYREEYDTTALRIYREAMPGYRIIGINCEATIPASGAIHCITHEIATADPMLIVHQNHSDVDPLVGNYTIDADIIHTSGIQSASVFYRTDTLQPYMQNAMTLINAATNTWSGSIPGQNAGDKIYYYIHAVANSGKEQVRPMPAPEGYFHFMVDAAAICAVNLGADTTITINETLLLEANVMGTAPFSYQWSTGAITETILVDGSLTGLGSFTYNLTITDFDGLSADDNIVVNVVNSNGAGSLLASGDVDVYPNPAKHECWITFASNSSTRMISIFDVSGKLMYHEKHDTDKVRLDLSGFNAGMYQIEIAEERGIIRKRIVVQ